LGDVVDVVSDEGDVEQSFQPMSCGIIVPQRIVVDVRISLPRLRALALLGDQAVGLGEAAQEGVVPSCVVKVQAEVGGVGVLAGVLVAGGGAAPIIARFAPGAL
jgi:hypothetical protein